MFPCSIMAVRRRESRFAAILLVVLLLTVPEWASGTRKWKRKTGHEVAIWADVGVLYYRKDLLEKHGFAPPRTWEEMTEIARAVQAAERAAGNRGMWGLPVTGFAYGIDLVLAINGMFSLMRIEPPKGLLLNATLF